MQKAKISLIGIPLDKNSSYLKGTAKAPSEIRKAFKCESSNMFSEYGVNLEEKDLIFDYGDIEFNNEDNCFKQIKEKISSVLDSGYIPAFLGGDHSITYPIIQALSKKYNKIDILQFDAHPDLYDSLDGNRYSHACPFARIMEGKLTQNLVQVGVRTVNKHQREQANKFGVKMLEMKNNHDFFDLKFKNPLYISFDIDALDPGFAPGVSHIEPGGLTTRQAISIIQKIDAPAIIGADIVEYNPSRDFNNITAMVCGKLLKEILGKILSLNF